MKRKLPNNSAAEYLGKAPATLRNSRHSGILAGVKAPAYIKVGRSVLYELGTLDEWLSQFEVRTSTKNMEEADNEK